jgi:hypothetical protein
VLSEQQLRALESAIDGFGIAAVRTCELRQLIAAARVANAAAQTDRDRRDGGEGNWVHYRRSRYGFHRALRAYTQPQNQQVSQ